MDSQNKNGNGLDETPAASPDVHPPGITIQLAIPILRLDPGQGTELHCRISQTETVALGVVALPNGRVRVIMDEAALAVADFVSPGKLVSPRPPIVVVPR